VAVSIRARIAALSRPGEVLVSGTVKDLVAGSGLEVEDRGEHQLKAFPGRGACSRSIKTPRVVEAATAE
jgi:class 3 adenylate cyclase